MKTIPTKYIEMNVDGAGSVSSGKSSSKRRAPIAPHLSQGNQSLLKSPVSQRKRMLPTQQQ
jgi:hypothetical protein